ncbi:MAG: CoA pyrophosphatase [Pseudomonadales bacterium]|nr:CoA pyrophosphatase [Pseudomonadales bacterium]
MELDRQLRERMAARLRAFSVRTAAPAAARRAAVAVLVAEVGHGAELPGLPRHADWQTSAALVLTRRAAHLRNHPGQWAFPGGRLDGRETATEAALREMREEIGVDLPPTAVLGQLDDFVTRSGFVITPVVIWGGSDLAVKPDPAEVASVHRIPLTEFLREDAPRLDPADGEGHPILRMPVGDDHIAAPTAALIYQFREVCLLGRATRVAHFEQPAFAWR